MTAPAKRLNLVPFVSVDSMMKLVLRIGAERAMTEIAALIEEDFRRWPDFDKTPRIASHSAVGVIELMPTSDGALYGFKYVNGHPANMKRGLQTVTAFGLLADVATGYPVLLSEMTILTALRTAAMSALAARVLAPPGATVMAMIGNGAQAEFQVLRHFVWNTTLTMLPWLLSPVGMCAGRWPACTHAHRAGLIRRMSPWALP